MLARRAWRAALRRAARRRRHPVSLPAFTGSFRRSTPCQSGRSPQGQARLKAGGAGRARAHRGAQERAPRALPPAATSECSQQLPRSMPPWAPACSQLLKAASVFFARPRFPGTCLRPEIRSRAAAASCAACSTAAAAARPAMTPPPPLPPPAGVRPSPLARHSSRCRSLAASSGRATLARRAGRAQAATGRMLGS